MRVLTWTREQFWLLPVLCVVVAGLLGVALTELDSLLVRSADLPFLFGGGPEGARALLSAIITSMISFTGLVFSITMMVLQLTSSQFSPRVLRTFLRDRFNQLALGVFLATAVYAMAVVRAVRGTAQVTPFVPQIAVTVSFVFVLARPCSCSTSTTSRSRSAWRRSSARSGRRPVGFGLRQLVDVAARALSPGVNDPTTAVQVLDQLHDLLRRLATRPLPTLRVVVRDGRTVVLAPATGFADHLD